MVLPFSPFRTAVARTFFRISSLFQNSFSAFFFSLSLILLHAYSEHFIDERRKDEHRTLLKENCRCDRRGEPPCSIQIINAGWSPASELDDNIHSADQNDADAKCHYCSSGHFLFSDLRCFCSLLQALDFLSSAWRRRRPKPPTFPDEENRKKQIKSYGPVEPALL